MISVILSAAVLEETKKLKPESL